MTFLAAIAATLSFVASEVPARRTGLVTRIDTAPVIDGVLDEACWRDAPTLGELRQMTPRVDAEPSERTEVRLLHDGRTLFIGLHCFDSAPAEIVATLRRRDDDLDPDDRVEIIIDTFRDRRSAYFFQIGAAGSIGDALMSGNGRSFNKPWDAIWQGRATIDASGWHAELAIPFESIAFDPADPTWGFNLNRVIKRKEEFLRWSGHARDDSFFRMTSAGDVTGLEGARQGLGLDLVPFFTAKARHERDGDDDLAGEPGLDAFYRITPSLQAALTLNTDFAETEVDDRRVNLTRFPLFFPEKRDFFLQDAGIFEFGSGGATTLLPFFSRRIGLDAAGTPVPIQGGGKLTGRAGDWNIGVLAVVTDATATLDRENLFVSRVSRNFGEQSSVGVLATAGDPTSAGSSATYGADVSLGTSRFLGDKQLRGGAYVLRSDNEGVEGDDVAFGGELSYPNDLWSFGFAFDEVQREFQPKLGFVPRTGVRAYSGEATLRPRFEGHVRRTEHQLEISAVTDLDDRLETGEVELQPIGFEFDSGDEARFELEAIRERLDAPFDIQDGVTIDEGEYDFVRARVAGETSQKRALAIEGSVEGGTFFDGERFDLSAGVLWRPSALFNTLVEYERNDVDLDAGAFVVHVGRARAEVAFSNELTWSSFVQVDNQSDTLGVFSRVRWILGPGREVFVVFNEALERDDGSVSSPFEELAFKIGWTLRF